MTITYVVKAGEWLAKIAQDHGTTVSAIWNHPENAGHRERRGSPDILYPGDELRLPVAAAELTTEPVGAVQPSSPSAPLLEGPASAPAAWPYPAFEGVWASAPTWECPGGTCNCHPVKEDEAKQPHTIVLYDPRGVRMPGARCRVEEQGRLISDEGLIADALGQVHVRVRPGTSSLRVEWAPPELPGQPFMPYRKLYSLKMDDGDTGLDRRLANLGFSRGRRRQDNVADYQRAYSREPTGKPDDVRLEVLERHDHGTLEPFHPQGEQADLERMGPDRSSFFAIPAPRSSSAATLAPQPHRGGAGGTKQISQGSTVPEVSDLILTVFLPADVEIDLARTKAWLRAVAVRDIAPGERDMDIPPTRPATVSSERLSFAFIGLPIGTYDALVVIEVAPAGSPRKVASGWRRVTVRIGSLTFSSIKAEVGRPVHSIDDPLLDVDLPGMQRRRKLLATLFTHFPMCIHPQARARGWKPPYEQGEFKRQLIGAPRENTCVPVMQSMLLNGLGATLPKIATPSTEAASNGSGDAAALEVLKAKDYFVKFTEGLAPSVGDVIFYSDSAGLFQHTGIIVDASPEVNVNWISADGGQPANATEFMKGSPVNDLGVPKPVVWARFWSRPEYENERWNAQSSWFLPRRVYRDEDGSVRVANGWAQPVWSPENTQGYAGYTIVGWVDLAHPSLRISDEAYSPLYTGAAYRACKELIRKVRNGALADQIACRSIAAYEGP